MVLFKTILPAEWIKLIVDGSLLNEERGHLQYEMRQPGAIQQVFNTLAFAIERRNTPLSVSYIKSLHGKVLMDVKGLYEQAHITVGKVRPGLGAVGFFIPKSRFTLEGLSEFLSDHQKRPTNARLEAPCGFNYLAEKPVQYSAEDIYKKREELYYAAPSYKTEAELEKALELLAQGYNEEIATAIQPLEKLTVIIKYIQLFERLHPFFDANGRVFVNVLLNALLIKNNFYPAVFFNPNVFDLYSVSQLVNVVIEAMWFFEYIALNPGKPLFYDHNSLSPLEKESLAAMSTNLVKALDSIPDEEQFILPSALLSAPEHLNLLHVVTGNLTALMSLKSSEVSDLLNEKMIGGAHYSLLLKNMHPIHIAARFGHIELLQWILSIDKTLIDLANPDGDTALHFAARFSGITTVKFLLDNGALINQKNKCGYEASCCAAESGTVEVFNFIKDAGCGKKLSPSFVLAWFISAFSGSNIQIIEQLYDWLEQTPDIILEIQTLLSENTKIQQDLNSAFYTFVRQPYTQLLARVLTIPPLLFSPHLNSSVLKSTMLWTKKEHFFLLVNNGVKPSKETLEYIVKFTEDNDWFIQTLRLPCVTSELLNNQNFLQLALAKFSKNDAVLDELFAKDLNPYLHFSDGSTFFHKTSSSKIDLLRYLKKHNSLNTAELNRENTSGLTPLLVAVTDGDRELVDFFLENHVTIPKRFYSQRSVIEQIAHTGSLELLALVLKHLPPRDFHDAVNSAKDSHPLIVMLSRNEYAMADLLFNFVGDLSSVEDRKGVPIEKMIEHAFPSTSAQYSEIHSWVNSKKSSTQGANFNNFRFFPPQEAPVPKVNGEKAPTVGKGKLSIRRPAYKQTPLVAFEF